MDKFLKYKGKGTDGKDICECVQTFLEKDLGGQLDGSAKLLKKLQKIINLGVDETWFEKAEAEGTLDEFEAFFMDVYVSVKLLLKSCEQTLTIGSSSKMNLSGYTKLKDVAKDLKKQWKRLCGILVNKRRESALDV
jgi:hypothetical protein